MYTAEGKLIGKVTHFFKKISVAVIELKGTINVEDRIKFIGKPNRKTGKPRIDFTQTVKSMQLEHEPIQEAKSGDLIGLQVTEKVCEGCEVYKL